MNVSEWYIQNKCASCKFAKKSGTLCKCITYDLFHIFPQYKWLKTQWFIFQWTDIWRNIWLFIFNYANEILSKIDTIQRRVKYIFRYIEHKIFKIFISLRTNYKPTSWTVFKFSMFFSVRKATKSTQVYYQQQRSKQENGNSSRIDVDSHFKFAYLEL